MKSLFVCTRPYQLFNYISFISENLEGVKGNCDILLCDIPSLTILQQKLENSRVFNHVYIFDDGRNGRINVFVDMVFTRMSMRRDFQNKEISCLTGYDLIVATSYHPFFVRVANLNANAKVVMVDDGMGSYLNIQDDRYRKSLFHKTLNFFFHKGIAAIHIDSVYLADPRMISHKSDNIIKELPKLSEETYGKMTQIFGELKTSNLHDKRLIYLTQPTDLSCMNDEYREDYLQNILYQYKHLTIVRKHPSQKNYSTNLEMDDTKELWELKCRDLSAEHILIAPFSTAQFTPHMLYGIDPKLIFLYKMLYKKDELIYSRIEEFLEQFKENYKNEIFVPETMDEVDGYIKKCLQ